jgi:hypothetical protein
MTVCFAQKDMNTDQLVPFIAGPIDGDAFALPENFLGNGRVYVQGSPDGFYQYEHGDNKFYWIAEPAEQAPRLVSSEASPQAPGFQACQAAKDKAAKGTYVCVLPEPIHNVSLAGPWQKADNPPLLRKPLTIIDRAFAGIVIGMGTLVGSIVLIATLVANQQHEEWQRRVNVPVVTQPTLDTESVPSPAPIHRVSPYRYVPLNEAAPEPTLAPTPEPAETHWTKPDPWKPTDMHRAEVGYVPVRMPYGEVVETKLLGAVPNQESLPLSGNSIGDAYTVGAYEFVWVYPGQWIDPMGAVN